MTYLLIQELGFLNTRVFLAIILLIDHRLKKFNILLLASFNKGCQYSHSSLNNVTYTFMILSLDSWYLLLSLFLFTLLISSLKKPVSLIYFLFCVGLCFCELTYCYWCIWSNSSFFSLVFLLLSLPASRWFLTMMVSLPFNYVLFSLFHLFI